MTDEDKARIVGMKRAGIRVRVIAERFGVTESAIANVCSRARAFHRLDHKSGGHPVKRYTGTYR